MAAAVVADATAAEIVPSVGNPKGMARKGGCNPEAPTRPAGATGPRRAPRMGARQDDRNRRQRIRDSRRPRAAGIGFTAPRASMLGAAKAGTDGDACYRTGVGKVFAASDMRHGQSLVYGPSAKAANAPATSTNT